MAIILKRMTGADMKTTTLKKNNSVLNNERGIALLETIPLIVIFVVLVSFGLGFFGIVHTAVLHSISARTYAFETFRQRTNLNYFRENLSGTSDPRNFSAKQWRYHGVQHETDDRRLFVATTRPISFGRGTDSVEANSEVHNQQIFQLGARNERVSVNPAWIMVGYGICLNATCGGN